jgi:adenylyltransferase/sulfurtransferase
MALSREQLSRYSRHILLPELGVKGQERLRASKVLVVGAGGLGCPAALYLAAAGVGSLGLLDFDKVDLSNLQRQILHWNRDLGAAKVASAGEKLAGMNPDVKLNLMEERLHAGNALALLAPYDLVIDGTDNFQAKFLINDACVSLGKTFLHAGILRFEGQLLAVKPGVSACYRCVFDSLPEADSVPSCAEAGVLGAVAGVLGSLLAAEALKLLLDLGEPLFDSLLVFDAKSTSFRKVPLRRRASCPVCALAGSGFQPGVEAQAPACAET